MTPLTVGMWHEMQPVAGLTGQIVACGASVNALPPLKWCSFWANPSLDELSAQGPVPTPWTRMDPLFSLDSVEPHRVTSTRKTCRSGRKTSLAKGERLFFSSAPSHRG